MTRKRRSRTVEYKVYSGSGHCGPAVFQDLASALTEARKEAAIPSYMGPDRKRRVHLVKVVTISEHIPFEEDTSV